MEGTNLAPDYFEQDDGQCTSQEASGFNSFDTVANGSPEFNQAVTRRACVNSKVRWLMYQTIQSELNTPEEAIAAQWILCHCHKQLAYDRNWWSRMERQAGALVLSNEEVQAQVKLLNERLLSFTHQLIRATAAVKKYIEGIDPVTNTLRKRDWNASTSLSEWVSGERGLLIKKLAANDRDTSAIKRLLPECLCEKNLKEALHNGGILIHSNQLSSALMRARHFNECSLDTEDDRQLVHSTEADSPQLNLVRPGAADTRMLDITLMDGSILPVRRSRCSLSIPTAFVADPVIIPKICVYDFNHGLHLYIFYRGHKMGRRKRPRFHVAEKHHLMHSGTCVRRHTSEGDNNIEHLNRTALPIDRNEESTPQSLLDLLPGFRTPDHLRPTLDNLRRATQATSSAYFVGLTKHQRHSMPNCIAAGKSAAEISSNKDCKFEYSSSFAKSLEHLKKPIKQSNVNLESDVNYPTKFPLLNQSGNSEYPRTMIPIQAVLPGAERDTYLLNAQLILEVQAIFRETPDVPPVQSPQSELKNSEQQDQCDLQSTGLPEVMIDAQIESNYEHEDISNANCLSADAMFDINKNDEHSSNYLSCSTAATSFNSLDKMIHKLRKCHTESRAFPVELDGEDFPLQPTVSCNASDTLQAFTTAAESDSASGGGVHKTCTGQNGINIRELPVECVSATLANMTILAIRSD